jgi:hypothetical protein
MTAPDPGRATARGGMPAVRTILLTVMLLGAAGGLAYFTNLHAKIPTWLFWRYAGYWIACLFWGLGCLSTGHLVVQRAFPVPLPFRERLGIAFAVGVFLYYFVASVLGFFYLYNAVFFFAVPAAMIAVGARDLWRSGRRFLRHVRAARARSKATPWWVTPLLVFGLLGLGMLYFLILSPENVQFDSRWKHFALAEQYAITHGVRRFPEGWTVETNPHLATYVYLWGFLLPFGKLFDRAELAAHLEFFIFVCTTLSISSLVRKLVPGLRTRHAWVARFLFPGVFLYDSSLSGGADHIAALFTVPMFLLLLRSSRDLSWRRTSLLALMVAGATMVKLTCLLMFVPVTAVVLGVRAIWLLARPPADVPNARRNAIIGPLAAVGVGLVAMSTFWAKNWIWYGDPIYPSLYDHLHLRPWTPDSPDLFIWGYQDFQFWRPTRDLKGVFQTIKALFNFSFVPNDYPRYHGSIPTFGSLFTLLLPCLLVLRKTRRTWALVGSVHVALFVWYWIHHQDRYLQPLLPWMSAVTAVTLIQIWQTGWPARIAASLLVGWQVIWGADIYFFPTHAMVGSPIKASIDLIAGGFQKDKHRLDAYERWVALGARLPRNARVLLHDNHVHLGIGAQTVSDWGAWQFGMSYSRHPTARETYDLMKEMGVTHLVWEPNRSNGWDSIAGDIVFFHFALRDTVTRTSSGGFEMGVMPPAPPTPSAPLKVAFFGCNKVAKDGLYDVTDLNVPVFGPRSRNYPAPRVTGTPEVIVGQADVIVLEPPCRSSLPREATGTFELAARRKAWRDFAAAKELTIWFRGVNAAKPISPPSTRTKEQDAEDAVPLGPPTDSP